MRSSPPGADSAAIDECVAAAQAELAALDADVSRRRSPPSRPSARLLVTNHDSLGYFADRYGFEVLGIRPAVDQHADRGQPRRARRPRPRRSRPTGVPAIFAETLAPATDAEALGRPPRRRRSSSCTRDVARRARLRRRDLRRPAAHRRRRRIAAIARPAEACETRADGASSPTRGPGGSSRSRQPRRCGTPCGPCC